jgi:hypothetical protein
MRRDRLTDITKLIGAFRCFAKAVIKKKRPDNDLHQAETSSLTDLHCGFVLTVFCEINISCFDCASELYSFPETLKALKRKKFTLQKICTIYISGNIKYIYTSLEICMCVHGRMIKSHGPYNCDLCVECLFACSESFVSLFLLFLAIRGAPHPHHYISLYRNNI